MNPCQEGRREAAVLPVLPVLAGEAGRQAGREGRAGGGVEERREPHPGHLYPACVFITITTTTTHHRRGRRRGWRRGRSVRPAVRRHQVGTRVALTAGWLSERSLACSLARLCVRECGRSADGIGLSTLSCECVSLSYQALLTIRGAAAFTCWNAHARARALVVPPCLK